MGLDPERGWPLDTRILPADMATVSTDKEILAAVDALPVSRKARLMPLLRRRLEDYYDLQAVKRAQKSGVYHPIGDRKDIYR